jgi:hypothetical protein
MRSVVEIRDNLSISVDELESFCRRNDIVRLAVYGSVLRDDFDAASDVDVLVEFAPSSRMGLRYFTLGEELSPLFDGRTVDLSTFRSVNRWIREKVMSEARIIYEAA